MKRSLSIAVLDDSMDAKLGSNTPSYEENGLVTSMMLVSIEEESRRGHRILREHRLNGSMSSISATSSLSRSSSRGSLRGWGTSASRKSYKVDLCSLAGDDEFNNENACVNHHHPIRKDRRKFKSALALHKGRERSNGNSMTNHTLDSWGLFLG